MEAFLKEKRKQEMIDKVLHKKVTGESYIVAPDHVWKKIVLYQFNKIYSGEMTVTDLCKFMQQSGIHFTQNLQLVEYPIRELLLYIAKLAKKDLSFDKGMMK